MKPKLLWPVLIAGVISWGAVLEVQYRDCVRPLEGYRKSFHLMGDLRDFDRLLVLHYMPEVEELLTLPGGGAYLAARSRLNDFERRLAQRHFQLVAGRSLSAVGVGTGQVENVTR